MASVENDTPTEIEVSVNEGQGTGYIAAFQRLGPGECKTLSHSMDHFNIEFFKVGEREKAVAVKRSVHRDSIVKLRCPRPGRWEVKVVAAKAAVAR